VSVRSEELDKEFRKWKEEIEGRCKEHLRKHPERKPLALPEASPKQQSKSKPYFQMPNTIVQVLESEKINGTWDVWMNGVLYVSFSGYAAQQLASSCASKLLNCQEEAVQNREVKNTSVKSPMCIFCGGRSVHRTDCPDCPV